MSFSLDTISANTLKSEARALREARATAGTPISHGEALEETARRHGYRDWNTASAMLPERAPPPLQVGGRVEGTYLKQNFTGTVFGVQLMADMQHYKVTVKFDRPVDVVTSELFSAFRQRVTAVVDAYGVSGARTSDGEPHMRVRRSGK
jgi:hypothetical protein